MASSKELEKRLERLESIMRVFGLPLDEWLSPEQASSVLCVSRKRLMNEINTAEKAHATKQRYDVIYGNHYRKNGSNWQINWLEMKSIINKRPEIRPVVN